jgi:hypothetical protein
VAEQRLPLANEIYGNPLDVPEAAAAWRVRRRAGRGRPQSVSCRRDSDDAAVAAALLLEVNLDASADEIRRALHRKLSIARLHPDQGGNGTRAAQLIAAKKLLIERQKKRS